MSTSDGLELEFEGVQKFADVTLEWQEGDEDTGIMTASFTDGRLFRGPYFRIPTETHTDRLSPLWEGWAATDGWRHWQPDQEFVKQYNGKILASLAAAPDTRMRCQLTLANHSAGMSGGGEGECQLTGGTTVRATLPPSRPVKG